MRTSEPITNGARWLPEDGLEVLPEMWLVVVAELPDDFWHFFSFTEGAHGKKDAILDHPFFWRHSRVGDEGFAKLFDWDVERFTHGIDAELVFLAEAQKINGLAGRILEDEVRHATVRDKVDHNTRGGSWWLTAYLTSFFFM